MLGPDKKPLAVQPPKLPPQGKAAKGKGVAKGKGKAAAPANAPLPGSVRFPSNPAIDPTEKGLTVDLWVLPDQPNGTLVHFGGPLVGFAL